MSKGQAGVIGRAANIKRRSVPLALLAATTAADLLAGPDISLIALLVAAPLIASFNLAWRETGVISALALMLALALGFANDFFSESDHLTRVLPVGLAGLLSTYASHLREGRAALLAREQAARLRSELAEQRAGETVALLDTLHYAAPVGFAFVDRDLRYVRANEAIAAIDGYMPADLIGRTIPEVIPDVPEVIELYRRVLRTGEPVIDREVCGETESRPGVTRHWLVSYYPVRPPEAEVVGVGAVVVEITDRKRAEQRASFLAEATATIGATLDYELALGKIARLVVPGLADWCVIDVVESGGEIRRAAIADVDPARERLLRELGRRRDREAEPVAGVAAAIRTGESQLHRQVTNPLLHALAHDEEHLHTLRQLGLRTAMVVPLTARGQTVGAISFAAAESGRRFDDDDLALAEDLADRIGAAIENARLYAERDYIARRLQQSLLPPRLPEIPRLEVAARYRAAASGTEVGGDFYDLFQTAPTRWGAVIGDVLGKGPDAAALIGLVRHTLRAAAMRDTDPARVLATLNEALHRERGEPACTALYLSIDVGADRIAVELTAAGHPLPFVRRAGGAVEPVGRPGTMLGVVRELELVTERVELDVDDVLVLFTDGVLEARDGAELFGEQRLRALLRDLPDAAADLIATRVEEVAVAFQSGEPRDDVAVLVLRARCPDEAVPVDGAAVAEPPLELRAASPGGTA